MSVHDTGDLLSFLAPFSETKKQLVLWLRAFVWNLYPETNELIYDNYNALAFGWSLTDRLGSTFCNVAIGRTSENVQFGFFFGVHINDTKKLLIGNGNQYRYLRVTNQESFPAEYIKQLLNEAYLNALAKLKDHSQVKNGLTITKSISDKKRTLKPKTSTRKK